MFYRALLFSAISFGLLMALSMGVAALVWIISTIVKRSAGSE
jgi:hypothetical protein